MSEKSKKAILLGLGAALAYSFVKGNGVFNKPRFYSQHKAMEKYLQTNHPGANPGEIVKTQRGWSCIINESGRSFALNMTKTDDGTYIFHESPIEETVNNF